MKEVKGDAEKPTQNYAWGLIKESSRRANLPHCLMFKFEMRARPPLKVLLASTIIHITLCIIENGTAGLSLAKPNQINKYEALERIYRFLLIL